MILKNLRDYNRSKTYETIIGHRKTYETNTCYHHYYDIDKGNIPYGETPLYEATYCCDLVGVK
jgi:hypothetical protein